jgi:hypothetical protein
MEENSPCKKITFSQPEGSWKKGRPKLRWLDSVLKDVKLMKVETWWKKARDRNICGRIIKEVKVHTGLLSQSKKKNITCSGVFILKTEAIHSSKTLVTTY